MKKSIDDAITDYFKKQSESDEMKKLWEYYSKSSQNQHKIYPFSSSEVLEQERQKPRYCAGCGIQLSNTYHSRACIKCYKKIFDKGLEGLAQSSRGKKDMCQQCFHHHKACKCPKNKAIEDLKR